MDESIKIIEKILGIIGYDAYDAFIKVHFDTNKKRIVFKTDNELEIKKNIFESKSLTLEQKVELNAVMGKNLKSVKREMDILGISLNNMEYDAKAENLSEDWILDFFDKASRITEEETKLIWGKLLAYAASNKNICSKTLLNSLFLMGTEELNDFLNICQYCLVEMDKTKDTERISAYPIIFFSKHVATYNLQKISSLRLQKLQNLGLLDVDLKTEYIFSKKKVKMRYKNRIIEVEHDKKIKIGNVRFTYEGFLLYQMTEKIYNTNILSHIIEIWRRRGYRIYVNGVKMKDILFSSENPF